jgi:hypothetical protein
MDHRKYRTEQRKAAGGIHCITLSVAYHPAVVIAFWALHWRAILEFSTRTGFVRPPAYHAGLSYAGWFRLEEKPWSLRESMSASGRIDARLEWLPPGGHVPQRRLQAAAAIHGAFKAPLRKTGQAISPCKYPLFDVTNRWVRINRSRKP